MLLDVLRVTLLIEPLNEYPVVYYGGGRKYFDVPAMTSDSNEPIWINKELDIEQYYPDRVSFRRVLKRPSDPSCQRTSYRR